MAVILEEAKGLNKELIKWVKEVAEITEPDEILICDGSDEEFNYLINILLKEGSLIKLNEEKYPGCYLYRSAPFDVARTEEATYICIKSKEEAGPNNNWMEPNEAKSKLFKLLKGCMRGRKMFVVPYILGPVSSKYSQVGVEITDSPYVVINLRFLTRMGKIALEKLNETNNFVKGIHSMGNLDPKNKYICHFPEEMLIISINSNYGGNSILSKKCHSLRLASYQARKEKWMAEHMLVIGLENPEGEIIYITAAFPSASGKTNLATLSPSGKYSDWKVWLISDDIAWMHVGNDGRLYAINPEYGFFGVVVGINERTTPNLMKTISKNTIFTNVALTKDLTPWWEGLGEYPEELLDWQGKPWKKGKPAAHPNSRFTTYLKQYPYISPYFEDPNGVPVSVILFGGRRSKTIPLVFETFSWEHGVLAGAMMRVETTAAAEGEVGRLRNDPMAMLPFCGYNIGDYFAHWLEMGERIKHKPRIFYVNWFRKNEKGKFIWPGFNENIRVLKWIWDRIKGKVSAEKTPIGYIPRKEDFDFEGLNLKDEDINELFKIDKNEWIKEFMEAKKFFEKFGNRFPKKLWDIFYEILENLK